MQLKQKGNLVFFLISILYYAGNCLFVSFMIYYLTSKHYSAFYCGLATVSAYLVNIIIQPCVGFLTDSLITIKKYLIISSLLVSATIFLVPMTSGYAILCLLAIMLVSLFEMPFMFLLDTWIVTASATCSKIEYGAIRAGGSIGYALASILFGWLIKRSSYSIIFPAQAILALAGIIIILLLPDVPLRNRRINRGNEVVADKLKFTSALKIILSNRQYLFGLVLMFFYWLSHRSVGAYLALIINDRGGNVSDFGLIVGLGAAVEAVILLLSMRLLRQVHLRTRLLLLLLMNLIRPLILLTSDNIPLIMIGQLIQSASFALYYTTSIAYFDRFASPQIKGTAITFGLAFTSGGGSILAILTGGVLCDWLGTDAVVLFSFVAAMINLTFYFVNFKNHNTHLAIYQD